MTAATMGCKICKGKPTSSGQENGSRQEPNVTRQYSWDKREKVNPKDFTIENIDGESVGRLPDTIKGQQFIIQNCKNANIYLFDHINTLTVDDCFDCNIVVGPTKGSVFVRDCKDCHLMVACQQFRTRDCQRMDTFLLCTTHPIIETSTQMRVGCYSYSYPELENQFRSAGLSIFNNDWHDVRDFTPSDEECNWSTLPNDCKIEDYIPVPVGNELSTVQVSTARNANTVPYTYGMRQRISKESSFVVFFYVERFYSSINTFVQDMTTNHPHVRLIRTKQIKMTVDDAQRVLQTGDYKSVVENGMVVGLEYNGDGTNDVCRRVVTKVAPSDESVYISDPKLAKNQLNEFFDLKDMQMYK